MSPTSQKPVLDEESFTRLLAAAYVMQEHTDRIRANVPVSDFTEIVAQIVECQQVIQAGKLELEPALELIVSRLQKVVGAVGGAVGVREGDSILYRAGSGTAAVMVGSSVPIDASLSAQCIRSGKTVKVPFAEADPQLDHNLVRRLTAESLLISPVYHEGKVAATIEVFFSEARLLEESAVRACELMAGLAAEAIAQSAEEELKQELAAERASVLMALETLKPQLQRLVKEPEAVTDQAHDAKPELDLCRACGHSFAGNETSCGVCGASRATGKYPGTELQSKWATLWERHLLTGETEGAAPVFKKRAQQETRSEDGNEEDTNSRGWAADLPYWIEHEDQTLSSESENEDQPPDEEEAVVVGEDVRTSLVQRWPGGNEGDSAQIAFNSNLRRIWEERRGDISLALATVVVLVAFVWGFWPASSDAASPIATTAQAGVTKRPPKPKPPQLSFLDRTLVNLGIAEAPPIPEYTGNPQTKVWVDLSTALYYCQGSDLYGKTPKGKFTSQQDALQDQFEPAGRKPCE
jgi:rubrerythrin